MLQFAAQDLELTIQDCSQSPTHIKIITRPRPPRQPDPKTLSPWAGGRTTGPSLWGRIPDPKTATLNLPKLVSPTCP